MEEQGSGVGLLFLTMPDMVVHGDYLHGHGHGIVIQIRGREREKKKTEGERKEMEGVAGLIPRATTITFKRKRYLDPVLVVNGSSCSIQRWLGSPEA